MRIAMFIAAAICLAATFPTPSSAATMRPPGITTASPDIVEVAGPRCGPHAHYIRGHRARSGGWIKGRCVRNHR